MLVLLLMAADFFGNLDRYLQHVKTTTGYYLSVNFIVQSNGKRRVLVSIKSGHAMQLFSGDNIVALSGVGADVFPDHYVACFRKLLEVRQDARRFAELRDESDRELVVNLVQDKIMDSTVNNNLIALLSGNAFLVKPQLSTQASSCHHDLKTISHEYVTPRDLGEEGLEELHLTGDRVFKTYGLAVLSMMYNTEEDSWRRTQIREIITHEGGRDRRSTTANQRHHSVNQRRLGSMAVSDPSLLLDGAELTGDQPDAVEDLDEVATGFEAAHKALLQSVLQQLQAEPVKLTGSHHCQATSVLFFAASRARKLSADDNMGLKVSAAFHRQILTITERHADEVDRQRDHLRDSETDYAHQALQYAFGHIHCFQVLPLPGDGNMGLAKVQFVSSKPPSQRVCGFTERKKAQWRTATVSGTLRSGSVSPKVHFVVPIGWAIEVQEKLQVVVPQACEPETAQFRAVTSFADPVFERVTGGGAAGGVRGLGFPSDSCSVQGRERAD